ncbi:beta/alpha barrel domain-containing protein [Pseudochryseolinea flava]|uniref:N-(5'-phosphoribosyl)anthranilate isomerase n=1 Tax=Pseudochryseolinea flava TaxID=2059302 RepID=A0A364XV46_9BACT|nr:N-(5'-phosphoribosyl)anthranilate isomerase [Pseudochryseolinea flava]RAV98006.1 N-(5'-phosphoribosyl)anthranilate isomerase [Pseudochryseolinea flava]
MPLKTIVKVGNITNLSDARYCAGMGVDMLGFNVVENATDYISPKSFQEIRGWITGPKIVAQIVGLPSAAALDAVLEQYRPDLLELSTAEANMLGTIPLPYILVASTDTALPTNATPAYVMIAARDTYTGDIPTLLQITTLSQLDSALADSQVHGIALEGSNEIRPGLKSYDDLADILEALEVD